MSAETQSAFDAEAFMHTTFEGANETKFTPIDEGEYNAYIDEGAVTMVNTKDGPKPVLTLTYSVTDTDVLEAMEMDKVTVRQQIWLDITESNTLDMGPNKNVKLGNVREAVGQNVDGENWTPAQLVGAGPVKIMVNHRYNKETGEGPYADVKRVTAG